MSDELQRHRINPPILAHARSLRRTMTPAEVLLWQRLWLGQLYGLRFRHQHPIGPYICDFYCARHRLIVEIDGDSHAFQAEYDAVRSEWLSQRGYRMIRFSNHDVLGNIDGVLTEIARLCGLELEVDNPTPT